MELGFDLLHAGKILFILRSILVTVVDCSLRYGTFTPSLSPDNVHR